MRLGSLLTAGLVLPLLSGGDACSQPPAAGGELKLVATYDCGKDTVLSLDYSTDGKRLAVAAGREALVWDVEKHQVVSRWADPRGPVTQVAFTGLGAGATLYVHPQWHPILLSPESGEQLGGLYHGKEGIFGVAFDPTRNRVVTAMQRELLLWEGTTVVRQWTVKDDKWFQAPAISPDGRTVAVAVNWDGVRIYSTHDGNEVRRFPATPGRQPAHRGFGYTKRGDELLIGDRDASSVRVIDVTGKRSDRFLTWDHPNAAPKPGGVPRQLPPYGIESLAHSPDGSTVALACNDKTVRIYETLTWGLRHAAPIDGFRMTFTPDSRHLAVVAYKSGQIRQFDWRVQAKAEKENDKVDLEEDWKALASQDAGTAYRAVSRFARNAETALPVLAARVKPVRVEDEAVVRRLVTELGASDFRTREAATLSLAKIGVVAEPFLRGALTSSSPEVVSRATRLLNPLTRGVNAERLRHARALELLEYFGTPAAIRVLQEVATGAPGLPETDEAGAALARLRVTQGR